MGFEIAPERYYTEQELRMMSRAFHTRTLERGRRTGALKFRETAPGQRVYLGAWILAWLDQTEGAA